MIKRLLPIGCAALMALSLAGCETPSQNATKRPDTMGSATMMLTGHRPKKKTENPGDEAKKMAALLTSFTLFGATYYVYYNKKRA